MTPRGEGLLSLRVFLYLTSTLAASLTVGVGCCLSSRYSDHWYDSAGYIIQSSAGKCAKQPPLIWFKRWPIPSLLGQLREIVF